MSVGGSVVCSSNSENKSTLDISDSPLSEERNARITNKLHSIPEVFAVGDLDYDQTTAIKHRIRILDSAPFKQRARPIHPFHFGAVRLHPKELCDASTIHKSQGPFVSPIVVVVKKNGTILLCVDYRKLNNQMFKDTYALPYMEETFVVLTGLKWM